MLVLNRKPGQSIVIDRDIRITITRVEGHRVKVGIEAPKERSVVREELLSDDTEMEDE